LGDTTLRGSVAAGFLVVLAVTEELLFGTPVSVEHAIAIARAAGASTAWQQFSDRRGRAIGWPFRIFLPTLEAG